MSSSGVPEDDDDTDHETLLSGLFGDSSAEAERADPEETATEAKFEPPPDAAHDKRPPSDVVTFVDTADEASDVPTGSWVHTPASEHDPDSISAFHAARREETRERIRLAIKVGVTDSRSVRIDDCHTLGPFQRARFEVLREMYWAHFPFRLVSHLAGLFACDERDDVVNPVKVVGAGFMRVQLEAKFLFDKGHQPQRGERVEDTARQ